MFRDVGKAAVEGGKGFWNDPLMLTGYEFRSMERLAVVRRTLNAGGKVDPSALQNWISRYCADISTGEFYAPQGYARVKPYNRLFLWRNDVRDAVALLNLTPAEKFDSV